MKAKFIAPYLIGTSAMLTMFNNSVANTASTGDYQQDFAKHLISDNALTKLDSICSELPQMPSFEPYAVQAIEHRRDVLYVMNNNDTIRRAGGTRAWRNMNPGNLVYGEFARNNGAIGKGGKFAVFPDEETGRKALAELLKSDKYCNLTIDRAIIKYAPPKENNVALYKQRLKKLTGLPLNLRLRDLDSVQMASVTNAIATIEGWRAGNEEYIVDQSQLLAANSFDSTKNAMLNMTRQRTL